MATTAQAHPFYSRVSEAADGQTRSVRLGRLVALLRCPSCGGEIHLGAAGPVCRSCGRRLPVVGTAISVLDSGAEYPAVEADMATPPSNHPYPPHVLDAVEDAHARGGWALDIGSGRRAFWAPRLVQTEICAYPFTDIINQDELLPFKDATFDFVFSLAVTEHVRRPWVLAAEAERVAKPGATIIMDAAFLQPIHAYPHHYFNMTDVALRSLFPNVEVGSLAPAPWQHPWFSVAWMLGRISGAVSDVFASLTVAEFLAALQDYCEGRPSLLHDRPLPPELIRELAAGFTLEGVRR